MSVYFDQVVSSYHRARDTGALFDTFYEIFLGKSPRIPPKFSQTDFSLQKRMLKQSILMMLNFYGGIEQARSDVEQLGEIHNRLEIDAELYELWLDALIESIQIHDPEYIPELETAWRDAMRPGIELMTSMIQTASK